MTHRVTSTSLRSSAVQAPVSGRILAFDADGISELMEEEDALALCKVPGFLLHDANATGAQPVAALTLENLENAEEFQPKPLIETRAGCYACPHCGQIVLLPELREGEAPVEDDLPPPPGIGEDPPVPAVEPNMPIPAEEAPAAVEPAPPVDPAPVPQATEEAPHTEAVPAPVDVPAETKQEVAAPSYQELKAKRAADRAATKAALEAAKAKMDLTQRVTDMAAPFTARDVKLHLVELESWLARAVTVSQYTDDVINEKVIPRVIRDFARDIQYRVNLVQVVSFPDGTYNGSNGKDITDTVPVYTEAAYPYYEQRASEYFVINLTQRPVQVVQRIRLMLNTGAVIYTIPNEWIVFDPKSGRVNLQPFTINGSLTGAAAGYTILQQSFGYKSYVPQLIAVDYQAGLPAGWEDQDEFGDLLLALEQACALQVLKDIAHLRDAGVNSKSIGADGLNQTLNYTRFADRKEELQTDVKAFKDTFKAQEVPIPMGSL